MNASTRIFGMLMWLGGLIVAGSILLALTAARIGEHKSSTYGNAYTQFQNSWGGEIGIITTPSRESLRAFSSALEGQGVSRRAKIIFRLSFNATCAIEEPRYRSVWMDQGRDPGIRRGGVPDPRREADTSTTQPARHVVTDLTP